MLEAISNAKEELKRADHLLYVSLKYTRTVDVFKSLIQRLLDCDEFTIQALLKYLKEKKKIPALTQSPVAQANQLKKCFPEDRLIQENIDLYLLLRKINKAEYVKAKEFRRHVNMTVLIEEEVIEINIDRLYEYYDQTRAFLSHVEEIIKT